MTDPKTNAADFNAEVVEEFRANGGQVAAFEGNELLLLTKSFDVTARELPAAERDEIIPKLTAAVSAFAEYQAKTSRVIPIFELQRTD